MVLLGLVALVYSHDLGRLNLWMDEIWWAFQVTEPELGDVLRRHAHALPPLLTTLAARAAMAVLPHTEAGFRWVSVLAALLAVSLFWKWSRFLPLPARCGLTLLFGLLPPLVTYSHLFKHYTADIAATIAVVLALEGFMSTPGAQRRPWCLGIAVAVALGFSFPVYFFVPVALVLILREGASLRRRLPALALLVVAVTYALAWGNDPATFLPFAPGSVPPPGLAERASWLVVQCGRVVATPLLPIPLFVQSLGLAAGFVHAVKRRQVAGLWSAAVLLEVAGAGALGQFPLAGGRFTVFLFPLVFMTFGLGLVALYEGLVRALEHGGLRGNARRMAAPLAAAALLALAAPGLRAHLEGRDGRPREQIGDAIVALRRVYQEGEGVFVNRLALAGWQWYSGDRSDVVGQWRRAPSGMDVYVGTDERLRDLTFAADMRRVFGAGKRPVFFLLTHLEAEPPLREADATFILRHAARYGEVAQLHAHEGALLWRITPP